MRQLGYGLIVAVSLLSFPWHPLLRSPNELCRLMQTRALVDFGELSLNRAMRVYGPVGDLSVFEGRYYPSKAPLMSFAAIPVYAVLRAAAGGRTGAVPEIPLVFFSRLFLTVLPTLLSLVLVERFLKHYVDRDVALAVTWTYALGTLAFSYSLLFMSHQTTATFLLVGFFLCWRVLRGEHPEWWLGIVGFLLGLAVVAEYTSALAALAIGGYATLAGTGRPRHRLGRALLTVGGALPAVVFLGWYHHECFGGVFETGYRHLADLAYQPWHEGGLLGIKTPTWAAFSGSFFSPLRGLFALSPVLLLSVTGIRRLWSARREHGELRAVAAFTVLLSVAYIYFTSSFSYVSWGWTTGPRHLTGWVPFLLLPAALEIRAARTAIGRGTTAGLAVSAILVTSALTFVNYIPDDVSEAVFGLFLPLARDGRVPPTALGFLGLSGRVSGWFVISLAVAAALLACAVLLGPDRKTGWAGMALVVAAVLVLHRVTFQDDEQDRAALNLLERVWLTGDGGSIVFWSSTGRATP